MAAIAKRLDDQQIAAVAAYYQQVRGSGGVSATKARAEAAQLESGARAAQDRALAIEAGTRSHCYARI
jgi:cytochrome c553